MTVHEDHLAAVEAARLRHRQELNSLDVLLKAKQDECKHKWGTRVESMFYALGETAPGKQCKECGAKKHVNR